MNEQKKKIIKRYLVFVLGLFFTALGSGFIDHAGLGTSPFLVVAKLLNVITGEYGIIIWILVFNAFLFLIQLLILRKNIKPMDFVAVPLGAVFYAFYEAGVFLAARFPIISYGYMLMCVAIGCAISAFGIALCFTSKTILNAPEALAKTISDKSKMIFGNAKIIVDVLTVVIAVAISMAVFGELMEVREGSVISAVLIGIMANGFINVLKDEIDSMF